MITNNEYQKKVEKIIFFFIIVFSCIFVLFVVNWQNTKSEEKNMKLLIVKIDTTNQFLNNEQLISIKTYNVSNNKKYEYFIEKSNKFKVLGVFDTIIVVNVQSQNYVENMKVFKRQK